MSWLEVAIMAFIVLSIAYVVWRGGAANPESTGELGQKINGLSNKFSTLNTRLGHVESEMKELQASAATTKDIARIEERIETVRAEQAGHHMLSANTNRSVERIERLLIEKGLSGK